MAKPPPTSPSTPKLSDLARHVVAPSGAVTTGWPAVEKKCRELGITFRPWQPGVGRLILAKRADGKYASTIGGTGLSIPRQVGKTFLVGAIVFALCLLHPNLTVIWTAHRLRTAEETFGKMQAFARRLRIAPHVENVVLGSGEEAIIFRNGSRILFGARESGFGLGFDEVDVLIFDEAQRLRDMTLDDMVPATNQSRQLTSALLLFMGTPPRPTDAGEVFGRMRREALTGEDEDTGWVEFGADEDFEPTESPAPMTAADWAQVAKANPSYPEDTPREAILRMRKKLGPDSYRREGLGIWDEEETKTGAAFDVDHWATLKLQGKPSRRGSIGYGVATAPDRSWTAIGAAWRQPDGLICVTLTSAPNEDGKPKSDYRRGNIWVPERRRRLKQALPGKFGTDFASRSLLPDDDHPSEVDLGQAETAFADLVAAGKVVHLGNAALDTSIGAAMWKQGRTSVRLVRSGPIDVSPLAAVMIAVHMLGKRADPLSQIQ